MPESSRLFKIAEDAVQAWNSQWENALKGGQGHAQSATGAPANTSSGVAVARVLAGPVWLAGEEPMDIHKTFEFAEDCITPYDQLTEPLVLTMNSNKMKARKYLIIGVKLTVSLSFSIFLSSFDTIGRLRLLATGATVLHSELKVVLQKDFTLWLVNMSNQPLSLGPGELFGFGLGGYVERVSSQARLAKDALVFFLKADSELIVHQEEGSQKKPVALAELIFQQAQNHGLMDVSVVDHKLDPMVKARQIKAFAIVLNKYSFSCPS